MGEKTTNSSPSISQKDVMKVKLKSSDIGILLPSQSVIASSISGSTYLL